MLPVFVDVIAFSAAVLTALLFWIAKKRYPTEEPAFSFSGIQYLKSPPQWIRLLYKLPNFLLAAALTFFFLAFIDPHLRIERMDKTSLVAQNPTEGAAVYFVLDHSGSMRQPAGPEGIRSVSKLQTAKDFIASLTKERPSDLLGLATFARQTDVQVPLTLDHDAIYQSLHNVKVIDKEEYDGTSIGYAILKTTNLIEATKIYSRNFNEQTDPDYKIKEAAIILVTDGFQNPNPRDKGNWMRTIGVEDAAAEAAKYKVKLYVVNIEPRLNTPEYQAQRYRMERIAKLTGGKFYQASEILTLQDIYRELDRIQKARFVRSKDESLYVQMPFYPYLIVIGLICMFLTIVLSTIVCRRVP